MTFEKRRTALAKALSILLTIQKREPSQQPELVQKRVGKTVIAILGLQGHL